MRNHLPDVCKDIIGREPLFCDTSSPEFLSLTYELQHTLPSASRSLFPQMISPLTHQDEKACLAELFKQLPYDCSVDTLVPYCAADIIKFVLECQSGNSTPSDAKEFTIRQQYFNVQITNALVITVNTLQIDYQQKIC